MSGLGTSERCVGCRKFSPYCMCKGSSSINIDEIKEELRNSNQHFSLAKELRQVAEATLKHKIENRPFELRDELVKRMRALALEGRFYIDFCFSDEKNIVDKTIELLKLDGFRHGVSNCAGAVRLEW